MIELENPKKEEVSEEFLKIIESMEEFIRLAEKGANVITVDYFPGNHGTGI